MVRKKRLTVTVDVKQNESLRTLNFSFQGNAHDRLRMIPSLHQAISPMKVPCIALSENVLSVILTKSMGSSEDHVTFIDEVSRLAAEALGYAVNDVIVLHGDNLAQFIGDLAVTEQLATELITMPNWEDDQAPRRHLYAL